MSWYMSLTKSCEACACTAVQSQLLLCHTLMEPRTFRIKLFFGHHSRTYRTMRLMNCRNGSASVYITTEWVHKKNLAVIVRAGHNHALRHYLHAKLTLPVCRSYTVPSRGTSTAGPVSPKVCIHCKHDCPTFLALHKKLQQTQIMLLAFHNFGMSKRKLECGWVCIWAVNIPVNIVQHYNRLVFKHNSSSGTVFLHATQVSQQHCHIQMGYLPLCPQVLNDFKALSTQSVTGNSARLPTLIQFASSLRLFFCNEVRCRLASPMTRYTYQSVAGHVSLAYREVKQLPETHFTAGFARRSKAFSGLTGTRTMLPQWPHRLPQRLSAR